jgi:hypothetical protein
MKRAISKRMGTLFCFCLAVTTFALYIPLTSYGAEYSMGMDVSPNIINLASQRVGEIRIFTDMRYAAFISDDNSVFIYFNGSDTVENIRATRDSWGNLILKFDLEDLLAQGSFLAADDYNDVEVVVVMESGDEYSGFDEVYLVDKNIP